MPTTSSPPTSQSCNLRYGHGSIEVALPAHAKATLIRKPPMPIVSNPTAAMATALQSPVHAPPLAQLARGRQQACILICDVTRPVPNALILRPLVQTLLEAGMKAENICVLVATGLHRPNEGAELQALIGDDWVLKNVRVENHFARHADDHCSLGNTSRGAPVLLDKRFVQADLRIVTGLVEPHLMAGYSGGRKVIAPGIAHSKTIRALHSARYMEHPNCANGILQGNPLHEDQLEIVEMLGEAYAVNAVIDEERNLSFVNFGEIVASHLRAVTVVRQAMEIPIERRFSTVLTCAAGAPLDQTYYQTIKGMVGAMGALAEGGNLIIAAECAEGLGSSEFETAQQRLLQQGAQGFLERIKKLQFAEIDEWQTEMQLKPMGMGKVWLHAPKLSQQQMALTAALEASDIEKTVLDCLTQAKDEHLAIIPEGPYVIPYVTSERT